MQAGELGSLNLDNLELPHLYSGAEVCAVLVWPRSPVPATRRGPWEKLTCKGDISRVLCVLFCFCCSYQARRPTGGVSTRQCQGVFSGGAVCVHTGMEIRQPKPLLRQAQKQRAEVRSEQSSLNTLPVARVKAQFCTWLWL